MQGSSNRHQPKKLAQDAVGAGAVGKGRVGLYGRPWLVCVRSCWTTGDHQATRAAIKAPTPLHTIPAPTDMMTAFFVQYPSLA